MIDFLNQFQLFGLGAIALIITVVEGIKAVAENLHAPLTPVQNVVAAVAVTWVVLGMVALVTYLPGSSDYVKYALAGIIGPLSVMGVYSGAKNMFQGLVSTVKSDPAKIVK